MTIQLTYLDKAEYLLVEASGEEWKTQDGVDAIRSMSESAGDHGHKLILLDRRNLSNPKTEFARFEAGQIIAELFPPPFRLAVVYPRGEMEKFGEDAAVNRGAVAKVFSDIEEARLWLIGDLPA